ncbi:MAG: hypothetical protein ABIN10_07840, partial [Specibacter sp.]
PFFGLPGAQFAVGRCLSRPLSVPSCGSSDPARPGRLRLKHDGVARHGSGRHLPPSHFALVVGL